MGPQEAGCGEDGGGGGVADGGAAVENVFGLDKLAPHCQATVAPLSCHCRTTSKELKKYTTDC
jgi:hypothetical protein